MIEGNKKIIDLLIKEKEFEWIMEIAVNNLTMLNTNKDSETIVYTSMDLISSLSFLNIELREKLISQYQVHRKVIYWRLQRVTTPLLLRDYRIVSARK